MTNDNRDVHGDSGSGKTALLLFGPYAQIGNLLTLRRCTYYAEHFLLIF